MNQKAIARRVFPAFALAAFVACFAAPGSAQQPQMPTAATSAVVASDTAAVFAEMDSSSELQSTLKKGTSVYVDLRMDQGRKKWCGVRLSQKTNRIGFVDCRLLERTGSGPPAIDSAPGAAASSGSRGAPAEIPLLRAATPSASGYAAMKNQVIKDGIIDSGFVATLDAQAAGGGSASVTRAALAHLAAGEFELSQHEPDKALEQFDAMDRFAGRQRDLVLSSLDGRMYALVMKSEYGSALDVIEQARKIAPQSPNIAAWSGWLHYRLNQIDAAIADLESSQRLRPNAAVAALLEKVKRDQEAEGEFREGESRHFVLRYHGGASRQLASEVIHTLEEQFQELKSELHYTPPEPIGVILYTQEAFRDVTQVPGWAGGANDGRIRVPVQGVENVSDAFARILKHELTHSFVFQKTSGRCPTWLQEGVAQWMEGRRSYATAGALVHAFEDGKGKQLRHLNGPWAGLSGDQARFAYAWALATVEGIEADSGGDGLDRLLDAVRTESSLDEALLQALRTNYSELDDATVAYLRRTYLQ